MREWLPELLALPLYPLLAWQGRRTRQRVPRLPEPTDEASGLAGAGQAPPLRLLLIGESPVAGVGVDSHTESIGAAFAQTLARKAKRPVAWRSQGINGITVAQAQEKLVPAIASTPVDIVCVAFGVNDSTGFRRYSQWRSDMLALLDLLQQRVQPQLIVLSGVPPLAAFPALPSPLRQVLGLKAASLDRALKRIANARTNTFHVPLPTTLSEGSYMAHDGYHPSAAGCRYWADKLAAAVPASFIEARAQA